MVVKLKKAVWVCPRRVISGSPVGARYGNHPAGAVIEIDDEVATKLIKYLAAEEVTDKVLFPVSKEHLPIKRRGRGRPLKGAVV
jgi:hypothetical protein